MERAKIAIALLHQTIDILNKFRHTTWPSDINCEAAQPIINVITEVEEAIAIIQERIDRHED
jgi:hypothetical protein